MGEGFSSGPRSAPTSGAPRSQSKAKPTKEGILREQIARMYFMVGAMIRPMGRFYPIAGEIGANFQQVSGDAAEAWMDLAQKDTKVKDALEKMVGASAWGNVIGIHLVIFATALPGGAFLNQSQNSESVEDEAIKKLRTMGLSEEEIAVAMSMAKQEFGQGPPIHDMPGNGQPNPASKSSIQTPSEQGAVNGSDELVDDGS
jgi:hypothetical protein